VWCAPLPVASLPPNFSQSQIEHLGERETRPSFFAVTHAFCDAGSSSLRSLSCHRGWLVHWLISDRPSWAKRRARRRKWRRRGGSTSSTSRCRSGPTSRPSSPGSSSAATVRASLHAPLPVCSGADCAFELLLSRETVAHLFAFQISCMSSLRVQRVSC
jgi:hypothetical protein